MRTRLATAAAECVVLVILGVGCAASSGDERSGTLVYTDGSAFPANLFPLIAAGQSIPTTSLLIRVLPAPFRVLPDSTITADEDLLATEPAVEETDTGQVVTYALNADAVWSDGVPITAEDFEFTWRLQRSSDPARGGCPALLGTSGYDQISSVVAGPDEHTVVVSFATPYPDWKALFQLLPAHVMDRGDAAANCTAVSTGWPTDEGLPRDISGGPWQLLAESVDDRKQTMTLTPNPRWYGADARLQSLVYVTLGTAEPGVAVGALRNGEVDLFTSQAQLDLAQRVRDLAPGVRSEISFGLTFQHLDLNTANVHLAKPEVRRAFALALDRPALVAGTVGQFDDRAQVLNNRLYVNTQPEYEDTAPAQYRTQDNAAATRLLESVGYVLGADEVYAHPQDGPLRLALSTLVKNPLFGQAADLIGAQVAGAGFAVTTFLDPAIFGGPDQPTSLEARGFDLALFTWTSSPFVSGNIELYRSGGVLNFTGGSDPQVDRLLDRLSTEVDHDAAAALAIEVDALLWADMFTVPLFQMPTLTAWSSDVEGVVPNATSDGPLWNSDEFWLVR